jgi:two-component system, NtrC family, nitrogen regulation sensor histidine kinase GlnL
MADTRKSDGRGTGAPTSVGERRADAAVTVLEALPFPALAVDGEGRVVFANGAAQDLFLRSTRALERTTLAALLSPDSAAVAMVSRARQAGQAVSAREMVLSGPSVSEALVDITAAPSDDGQLVAIMVRPRGKGRDLSERLQDLAGARSMAALGNTLAHEVKNPLAGIRGAAQLLMHDLAPDQGELAQLIVDETDRIRRLIDRMESFGADPPVGLAPVNVHAALERVAALAENGFGTDVRVVRRFDPSLPEAMGDQDQLIQAFLNLAKNAAEAAGLRREGGEILLSTAYRHGVRVRSPGGETRDLPLEIAFQDNGPGISEDLQGAIFEPFVTTKSEGGGLGLPLVQKIVAAHGGVVDFESEPGRTVFRVRLPLSRTQPRTDGSNPKRMS